MDFSKLRSGEIAAAVAGILLAIAVFLPAYSPNTDNPNATVLGLPDQSVASIWEAQTLSRYIILIAAIAPVVLLYIIARGHQLSWPRGELTAVLGLTAATLLLYSGVIERPGEPSGEVSLSFGWFLAVLGALVVAAGGAIRSSEHERKRKPPGVL
jgi:predicted lysophospholipase L1 biosynthesis ABC-type transport system permease subunit